MVILNLTAEVFLRKDDFRLFDHMKFEYLRLLQPKFNQDQFACNLCGELSIMIELYAFGNGILGCSFAFETIHLYNNYFQPREETTIVVLKGRNIICLKWFAIGDGFCRSWGILSLTIAYCWQLYTLWILVQLHEAVPGKRYNRYVELAQAAFGENTCLSSNSNTSIVWRIGSNASPQKKKKKKKNSNN